MSGIENQTASGEAVVAESPPQSEPVRSDKTVIIRYGRMGQIGLFTHDMDRPLAPGRMLVVRTERGTELGKVLINITPPPSPWGIDRQSLESYLRACGEEYPFTRGGKVLRRAGAQDINDQQHLDGSAGEERTFCREQIAALNMPMQLVSVEHLLGGERIIFYFASEHRVDFRELVRRLAGRYHTRIEMRQVGARDEARLIADYERCGRQCCCREYLKFLKPVSMRMAKVQKATLDPSKISGRCGRLMCCLRHEDQTYEQLQAKLPRKNIWVKTKDGVVGKVVDVQVLTQLVRLLQADMTILVTPVDDIVERGVTPPSMPAAPAGQEGRPRIRRPAPPWARKGKPATSPAEGAQQGEEPQPAGADDVVEGPVGETPQGDDGMDKSAAMRPAGTQPQARPESSPTPQMSPGQPRPQGQGQGGSRRRRHRRRKKHNPNALSVPPQVQPPRNQGGQNQPPPRPLQGNNPPQA